MFTIVMLLRRTVAIILDIAAASCVAFLVECELSS